MGAESVGKVRSGKTGKQIDVKWDQRNGDVYVEWAGSTKIKGSKAKSASQAANMAETFLRDK